MSREDTMICMDNSEWMRNGDYYRTRFEAQYQAIEHVTRTKGQNPENTVGLVCLAGGMNVGVQVLCSLLPPKEHYKVGTTAHAARIGGKADILNGIKVAQLALKHRANKQVQARIILFVGSPLNPDGDAQQLATLARQLKKNNVAVDIISMGENDINEPILREFVKNVEKSGVESSFIIVPPGSNVEDAIKSSSMNAGVQLDEDMDPDLAVAIRESMEMEQQRLGGQGGSAQGQPGKDNFSTAAATEGMSQAQTFDEDDEDAILEQAKLMSMIELEAENANSNSNDDNADEEMEDLQKAAKKDEQKKK